MDDQLDVYLLHFPLWWAKIAHHNVYFFPLKKYTSVKSFVL